MVEKHLRADGLQVPAPLLRAARPPQDLQVLAGRRTPGRQLPVRVVLEAGAEADAEAPRRQDQPPLIPRPSSAAARWRRSGRAQAEDRGALGRRDCHWSSRLMDALRRTT